MKNKLRWDCKVELFKRGEFEKIPLHIDNGVHYFSPKQIRALKILTDDETNFLGYGGGAFSGKSLLECYWCVLMAYAYPGTRWGLGRKTMVDLKRTVLMTMFKILASEGLEPKKDYKYVGNPTNVLKFSNESEVVLLHMAFKPDDPLYLRFGGLEITGAAVDESNEAQAKGIGILFTRLGRWKNDIYGLDKKKLLESFNPDRGHVYRRYYKPWKNETETPNKKFIRALPKDNPSSITESYIQDIIDMGDKTTIERLIHGNFEYEDDPTLLVTLDAVKDMYSNDFVKEGRERYLTIDVAGMGVDKTVMRVWYGFVCVERRQMLKNDTTQAVEMARDLMRKHRVTVSNTIADTIGIGAGVGDILRCKKFISNAKAGRSTTRDRTNDNEDDKRIGKAYFKTLKDQCGWILADMINNNEIWDKTTWDEKIEEELLTLKHGNRDKPDDPKKLIGKDIMKELLGGRSPDDLDNFIMRMYFVVFKPNSIRRL